MISLARARALAFRARFAGDLAANRPVDGHTSPASNNSRLAVSELPIAPELTPELWQQTAAIARVLHVPLPSISAFIYPSAELQATCFASAEEACTVQISSALVELLDESEFSFVVGHEVGHFLLRHGFDAKRGPHQDFDFFRKHRAQELSADRIGLIACGSLDSAIRALMKTASGLTARHLRFDAAKFISQLQHQIPASLDSAFLTHPSILVRCRALLWFSMQHIDWSDGETDRPESLDKIDRWIQADLDKYIDAAVLDKIASASSDLDLWLALECVLEKGAMSKRDQAQLGEHFGQETIRRMGAFLHNRPTSEVKEIVMQRVLAASDIVANLASVTTEDAIAEAQKRVSEFFLK